LTAEQLEAARSERMRQNGHAAITLEDARTWIEETGLCIFLPRSAQAGFTAPTFVEAVAGQRTPEPTLELIETAEQLLVRLEAEGVAVRLNLAGQPGDQPDYVVAGWVLPYVYALRGDRDWRRGPQLTGSRQVSQLAVQASKQLEQGNQNAGQIRDALGREVTETAVLRALHELWKQLRIIPVVPEAGQPALWQPLRQRFQKAIAEGASTSQVTAISVLASIYLQAVIAASMEDVELFLSPLTSRSKIREVVRGLAATRQVHTTNMGHQSLYYVAGTLPDFPAVPAYQTSTTYAASYLSATRGSSYQRSWSSAAVEEEIDESEVFSTGVAADVVEASLASVARASSSRGLGNKVRG
jgi:23S rRNA pseudouridine2605 synthase